jgi:hypothetical protein
VTAVPPSTGITKYPGQVDATTLGAMVDLWRTKRLPRRRSRPRRTRPLLKIGASVVPPYPASHGCVRTHDWTRIAVAPDGRRHADHDLGHNPGNADEPAITGAGYSQ